MIDYSDEPGWPARSTRVYLARAELRVPACVARGAARAAELREEELERAAKARQARWRAKNRESINAYMRAWREKRKASA